MYIFVTMWKIISRCRCSRKTCTCVFSEPPVDVLYKEQIPMAEGARVFSVEYLPGQFDQRADSAVQCVQFLKEDEQPIIKSATTYVIEGTVSDEEFEAIKNHCINPVDSRETGIGKTGNTGNKV